MSEVIYLDTRRFIDIVQRASSLNVEAGPRVYIREARDGIWLVHDEDDCKGGCFRNRRAAFQFVEDEYGPRAEIVVQPRFPTARQPVHIKQATSVAHRAVSAH